jgi:hypothetical protein
MGTYHAEMVTRDPAMGTKDAAMVTLHPVMGTFHAEKVTTDPAMGTCFLPNSEGAKMLPPVFLEPFQ